MRKAIIMSNPTFEGLKKGNVIEVGEYDFLNYYWRCKIDGEDLEVAEIKSINNPEALEDWNRLHDDNTDLLIQYI